MKTADCDILIVPGLGGSEEDHWQARWAGRLATARVVEQDDWHAPTPEAWCGTIAAAVARPTRIAPSTSLSVSVLPPVRTRA